MEKKRITIVAPAYNEAESVAHFAETVTREMTALPYDYTILLVNDGSTDDTSAAVGRLEHAGDPGG